MLKAVALVVTLLIAVVAYFTNDILKKRRQLDGLPQPPMQNRLFGHLHLAAECSQLFPEMAHTHTWVDYFRTKYDLPEIFYVDWRPAGPLWMYVCDPELSSQYLTTTQSLPKSLLETAYLNKFLGDNNLASIEGAHWKQLRSMFNPGFSATNIMTLAEYIVDSCTTFSEIMRGKARTAELFELEEYTTRLTIDIIGKAVLDVDMQAQTKIHPLVHYFRERVLIMPPANAVFFWQGVSLLRPFRLWWNGRKLDGAISDELDSKILRRAKAAEEEMKTNGKKIKKRSVLDLALDAYEKEIAMGEGGSKITDNVPRITKPSQVPASLRTDIIDSVKTFIFAGHDTTSSTICWAHYLLHRYPKVQQKLKEELDSFFPPGTDAAEKIKEDPYIVNKLEYTTAVLRETMRVFPPASTIRAIRPGFQIEHKSIKDPKTGKEYPMEGADIWPVVHLINRNKRFFPEPTQFIPERFIPSQTPFPEAELFTPAGKDAFRPFEKGPRNCAGQELAMIEGRIILALTAREFDFIVEFPGEEADPQFPIPENTVEEFSETTEYGKAIRAGKPRDRIEGHRLYQVLKGSAKPVDGCPGRIRIR